MSNKPTAKFWGGINKQNLDQVLSKDNAITNNEKYGDQIMVDAAQWDGENITVNFYDKANKESIKLLTLRPQKDGTFAPSVSVSSNNDDDDSPF